MNEENKPSEAQIKYAKKLREDLGERGNEEILKILKSMGKELISDFKELNKEEISKVIKGLRTALGYKDEYQKEKSNLKDKMKDYVTFEELLKLAHERYKNRLNIYTRLVEQDNKEIVIFKATIQISATKTEPEQIFNAYGDATEKNVNSMVEPHKYRVAETRSLVRCLRFCLGIGMTAREELGGEK